MNTTDGSTAAPPDRPARFVRLWSLGWGIGLALLFVAVTALTLAVWFADAGAETNPVVDVAFLAVGLAIAVGFASQARQPWDRVAGAQQSVLAAAALAVAGAAGARIEPFLGGLVVLLAAGVPVARHPPGAAVLRPRGGIDRRLAALGLLAAAPALWVAISATRLARDAGPSCFLGQCAAGDRQAELAAWALTMVLLTLLASRGAPGWRLPAWTAGLSTLAVGAASVLLPNVAGSLGSVGGLAAVTWGAGLLAVSRRRDGGTADTKPE